TVLLVLLLAVLAGCGGASSSAFPSRSEVDAIAAAPPPSGGLEEHSLDVPSWELRGAPVEAIEVAAGDDPPPWGALLAGAGRAPPSGSPRRRWPASLGRPRPSWRRRGRCRPSRCAASWPRAAGRRAPISPSRPSRDRRRRRCPRTSSPVNGGPR